MPTQTDRLGTVATPEPADLYGLIVLVFVTHVPYPEQEASTVKTCLLCGEFWPCPSVRLAARNRDGF